MREQPDEQLGSFVESLPLPVLRIAYEDLMTDEESFFRRIYDHLGVKYCELRGPTVKNISDDLRQAITNFDELRSIYAKTDYQSQFDEK